MDLEKNWYDKGESAPSTEALALVKKLMDEVSRAQMALASAKRDLRLCQTRKSLVLEVSIPAGAFVCAIPVSYEDDGTLVPDVETAVLFAEDAGEHAFSKLAKDKPAVAAALKASILARVNLLTPNKLRAVE